MRIGGNYGFVFLQLLKLLEGIVRGILKRVVLLEAFGFCDVKSINLLLRFCSGNQKGVGQCLGK